MFYSMFLSAGADFSFTSLFLNFLLLLLKFYFNLEEGLKKEKKPPPKICINYKNL